MQKFAVFGDTPVKLSTVLVPPDFVNARLLAANVAENVDVPPGARIAVFSATGDFYARYDNGTAAVPGDVTDGSAAELNPVARYLDGVTRISLVSAATPIITVAFYS